MEAKMETLTQIKLSPIFLIEYYTTMGLHARIAFAWVYAKDHAEAKSKLKARFPKSEAITTDEVSEIIPLNVNPTCKVTVIS